ncbi:S9 family peptidase [Halococcus hamelinensis]|uniref:Dipeptidyl aminopeptidase/acylaminoacyl peptidase n=1 Tax=Halococcus hamelinensis 100A6 TaxID=1132509 RepID=M0M1Q2_9EURY|nr:S9 family peptidase [Halococcus hamelinensis]EMA39762.1 dipeptidyl aminopeptidase/acylaminoacyl peptidase [Halococcus hamelinensis 100A6]
MTDPIPLDSVYDVTTITAVALSPDGDHAAFVARESSRTDDERHTSVFVVPTDGSRPPHRLTRASDAGSPQWSPDGTKLGVLAVREHDVGLAVTSGDTDEDGTEPSENGDEPKSQVWVFDLELGGDARQVTDRDEGVREFDWGPDGERVVVSARDPTDEEREYLDARREGDGPIETERLQHKADGAGWLDSVTSYLFVVDVETRESTRLDEAYGGGAYEPMSGLQPAWSPAGDRIAFLSNRTERPDDNAVMDLYTVAPDGTDLSRLTESDLVVGGAEWHPDGDRLAFVGSDPENSAVPGQVYVWDGDGYESLTPDLDRRPTRQAPLRWDDGTVLTAIADEADVRFVRAHPDGAPPERVFPDPVEHRTLQTFDLAAGTLVALVSHPSAGVDLHTASLADLESAGGDAFEALTAVNEELLDGGSFPDCERVRYESAGHEIDAVTYLPPGFDPDDPEPHPLVVSIHGGPVHYDVPEFDFEYAAWTSRGYVVVCPNYRGGASYGRAFAEELRGQWGTVEVEDIAAGIEALCERGWADPDRVFGRGVSYGGIAQGFLVTQTDLLTAAAPEHGIYDLRSVFGTDDTQVGLVNEFGLPWEAKETYDAASAIRDAGNIETPLLVMAGDQDWRCPPSQSEQLYVSARKRGVDAKLVVYPDEHHNVGDPDRALHRLEQLTEWYEKHDPALESTDDEE